MEQGNGGQISPQQRALLFLVLGLTFLSLLYRVGILHRTDATSLLVVGVPAGLAVLLLLVPQPRTLTGQYLKWATLGLLLLGVLAGEAFVYLLGLAPLLYLGAYLLARTNQAPSPGAPPAVAGGPEAPALTPEAEGERVRRKQTVLIAIVGCFAVISIGARLIYAHKLETSSVMFIAMPAALSILLILTVRPKSSLGTAMAGTTFVLLLSAILFGEGLVCILMAAPIFYLVAAIIGALLDSARRQSKKTTALCLLPVLLMSLEGSHARLSFPREEAVSARRTVAATPEEVQAALGAPMRFRTQLPLYLKLGFPRPVEARGSGMAAGDQRIIHFAGGEGHPGDLVMQVESSGPGGVTFHAVSDRTKVAHWLDWEDAVVSWQRLDEHHTAVTWTLRYRRKVDPAWYFAPWEHYAVRLAGEYLIENLATPAR
jgi:hypothetical protein